MGGKLRGHEGYRWVGSAASADFGGASGCGGVTLALLKGEGLRGGWGAFACPAQVGAWII